MEQVEIIVKLVSNTGQNNFICGFGDADNAQAIKLKQGETKTVNIGGVSYEIRTTTTLGANALLYSVNPVTGVVSFSAVGVIVKGQTDVSHNVELYGKDIDFLRW